MNKPKDFPPLLLALPLAILPFISSFELMDPALLPRFLGLTLLVLAGLIWTIADKEAIATSFWRNKMVWVYVAYLIWMACSAVFGRNPGEGLFELQRSALYFMFMLLMAAALEHSPNPLKTLAQIVSLFTLAIAGLGLIQFAMALQKVSLSHQLIYQIHSSFTHKNLFSQILLLSLPFTLWGVWKLRKTWRLVCLLAATCGIIGVILLMSRGVWIGLALASLSTFALAWVFRRNLNLKDKIMKRFLIIGGTCIFLGLSLSFLAAPKTFAGFWKTSKEVTDLQYGSPRERILMWKASVKIFADHPLLGVGPGNWRTEFPAYGIEGLRPEAEVGEHHFQRPHNDFLWVLSETGLPGFILYLAIFGLAFLQLLQRLKSKKKTEHSIFALLLIFGMIAYSGIAFFSFPKERIIHSIYFHLILASSIFLNPKTKGKPHLAHRFLPFLGIIIAITCLITGVFRTQGEYFTRRGLVARAQNNPHKVIEEMNSALSFFYKMDPMSTPINWYIGEAQFMLQENKSAKNEFLAAVQVHPNHIHVRNNLGSTLVLLGEPKAAKVQYQKALAFASNFDQTLYNLAAVFANENQADSAWYYLSQAREDYENPRYIQFANQITWVYTRQLFEKIRYLPLKDVIKGMHKSKEWRLEMHQKAIMDNLTYEYQVIMDGIYILEKVENKISFEKADSLRNQYLPSYSTFEPLHQ